MQMDMWYELAIRELLDLDEPAVELRKLAEALALPQLRARNDEQAD